MKLRCPKCGKQTIDAKTWWLDRLLKYQVQLVANRVKYPRIVYQRWYDKSQKHIEKLDPWYRIVKD